MLMTVANSTSIQPPEFYHLFQQWILKQIHQPMETIPTILLSELRTRAWLQVI